MKKLAKYSEGRILWCDSEWLCVYDIYKQTTFYGCSQELGHYKKGQEVLFRLYTNLYMSQVDDIIVY